jgi:energy-coupling factor transporter ATP-binding protein EcfA2
MSRQTFLEPFNAKAMSYAEVARTFVPSTKFTQLAGAWNSVLVGPRGGGKTTLFKMLSAEGQEAWTGATAEPHKKTVGYTGIYVPSDIAWGTMLESLIDSGQDETVGILFSEAAFVTHVLLSVATGMDRHVALNPVLRLEPGNESAIGELMQADLERVVATIAMLWKVQPVSLSPASLVDALRARLLDIKRDARLRAKLKQTETPTQEYLGIDMLEAASQALQIFDAAYRRPDHRWCLLLDEFEVAPMHLQKTVLAAMRASGAQKLLLKVALAPCGPDLLYDQQSSAPPSQNNDVQQVQLWYADKAEASEFCQQVFLSRSSTYSTLAGKMPSEVFGSSAYAVVDDSDDAEQIGLFTITGRNKKQVTEQFQLLARKDPTFQEFLFRKQIDVSRELGMLPADPHGNTLRKIAPLVAFRNAYKGKNFGNKRGVKPFNTAYSGWESIAAISEGNPRWLIGLITRIMSNSEQSQFPVPTPQQTAGVLWNCQRYAEMLQSVANEQFGSIKTSTPIYEVLSKIGDYFHNRLVRTTFVEDPPMSFVVDERVSDDVEHALRIAVNHGAIVCYQIAADVGGFRTLRGLRFRLTYLLAPVFKLPMRKSKAVSLSTILEAKPEALVVQNDPSVDSTGKLIQRDLWAN